MKERENYLLTSILISLSILILSTIDLYFKISYPFTFLIRNTVHFLAGIIFLIAAAISMVVFHSNKKKIIYLLSLAISSYFYFNISYKFIKGIHFYRFTIVDLAVLILGTLLIIYIFLTELEKLKIFEKLIFASWILTLLYVGHIHYLTLNHFYTTYYFSDRPQYLYLKSDELYYEKDLASAEEAVKESISMYETLVFDKNHDFIYPRDIKVEYYGKSIQLLGSIKREKGDYQAAKILYDKARIIFINGDPVFKKMLLENLQEQVDKNNLLIIKNN